MEKLLTEIVIVAIAISISCAFPGRPCNTDADCDGDDAKCIAGPGATKKCAYCFCPMTNQCEVTNDYGNRNFNGNDNNNGNGNGHGYAYPTATCNCDDNTVQPICEPTCAYSPHPCGNNTVCEDEFGTAAANCSCQDGYEGDPIDGCIAPLCFLNATYNECGGDINAESGTLRYPTIPCAKYLNNENCNWLITTTPGKILHFSFDYFEFETCCDYLKFFDVVGGIEYLLGEFNGRDLPNDVFSTQNQVRMQFTSDFSVVYRGFVLGWTSE